MITRGVSLGTGEITATNENIPHKLSILSTISWLEPSLPMYTKAWFTVEVIQGSANLVADVSTSCLIILRVT